MSFWKCYFNLMDISSRIHGKIKTFLIFTNPIVVIIMYKLYVYNNRKEEKRNVD